MQVNSLKDLSYFIVDFITQILPVVAGLGFLAFLWGVTRYIGAMGDEKKVVEGKNVMLYGLIGIFVMFMVWGIVNLGLYIVFGSTQPEGINPSYQNTPSISNTLKLDSWFK